MGMDEGGTVGSKVSGAVNVGNEARYSVAFNDVTWVPHKVCIGCKNAEISFFRCT